jgi:hypothetical protein
MDLDMFAEYIQAALEKAQYEVIDNGDKTYFVMFFMRLIN